MGKPRSRLTEAAAITNATHVRMPIVVEEKAEEVEPARNAASGVTDLI